MAKRLQSNRTKLKNGVGKTMGRCSGPLVFNEDAGRKVTPKVDRAIKSNKAKRAKRAASA